MFNTVLAEKVILVIIKNDQHIYLVGKYKNVDIWHQKLKYISNTRIISIIKFIINITSFQKKSNLLEIYSNLNILELKTKNKTII